jgi:hypothetical protein
LRLIWVNVFYDGFVKAGPGSEEAGSYCFEPRRDGGTKTTLVQVLDKVAFGAHFVDTVGDEHFVGAQFGDTVGKAHVVGGVVGAQFVGAVCFVRSIGGEVDSPQAIGFVAGAT